MPQTRREGTLIKENTEGETGKGEGKRKWRQGKPKEDAAQHTTQSQTGTKAPGKGKDKSAGSREMETPPEEGEGMAGDVPGYKSTPEDLRIREVYGDWVHANPGMHLDGVVRDDSVW